MYVCVYEQLFLNNKKELSESTEIGECSKEMRLIALLAFFIFFAKKSEHKTLTSGSLSFYAHKNLDFVLLLYLLFHLNKTMFKS